jgi:hypothetical protein
MFCNHCGNENPEGARFCCSCGQAINGRKSEQEGAEGSVRSHSSRVADSSQGTVLQSIASRLSSLASTDKLEGFSLSSFFSEVFKKRSKDEIDDYFVVGPEGPPRALRMFLRFGPNLGSF